ncbi:DUF7504 family protein [Natronococcus wangiae]|uniref:DUF7504 family protein n=1 Tax=Natronococcus wangiae TaxID=3068275 RepID=UPI00273F3DB1|nr:hypothetical protein [Natronococcus sp. AD5]
MFSETDRRDGPDDAFIEELSRLKRQGASVLVVGSTRASQQTETCRRLLGQAIERPRRRILVSTTGETGPISDVVSEQTADRLSVITHDVQTRSATASESSPTLPIAETPTRTETLVDLGVAISSAIEAFDTAADGLEPSELRIGVDSLLPLLEEYSREQVFRFVHLTNGRTRDADGMIHYLLPVEREADIVSVLAPLFDVIVELRERNGVRQERWTLKNGTLCSGWISTTRV